MNDIKASAPLSQQKSLYWFTHDLRLDDNPSLTIAAKSQELICLYCIDPRWFNARRYHLTQMGALRWQFLQQQLADLKRQLSLLGQTLFVVYQEPEKALVDVCHRQQVSDLYCCRQFGTDERQTIAYLQQNLPSISLHEYDQSTLLHAEDLKQDFSPLTAGYTPFKKRALIALETIAKPLPAPMVLAPGPKSLMLSDHQTAPLLDMLEHHSPLFAGGETQAHHHLDDYLQTGALLKYKETRDQLSGFDNSSKLSAWLNTGALSPKRVLDRIHHYESLHEKNASTQWMVFELLWREYFHWLSRYQGASLFSFKGLRKSPPLTSYYAQRFQKWCQGNTAYPLVNACMRELKATGYLSNRGRQIAASCLVNELQVDWRYGAAWFEHNLLDYQVSVNWGNWQYIAGVGVDPRGGRYFNLEKQQQRFDPDGLYIKHWCADENFSAQAKDAVDAADWPIL